MKFEQKYRVLFMHDVQKSLLNFSLHLLLHLYLNDV
jgi:hypothetical protein